MNKPKKPAVVAKAAKKPRKVLLTQSDVLRAKAEGVSLEEIAKSKLPKRGRPVGSKNKPKTVSFQAKPMFSDWEKLAKQLQAALAAEIKDGDMQQEVIDFLNAELNRKRTFWERLVCLATGAV